jgi:hypothetical protein
MVITNIEDYSLYISNEKSKSSKIKKNIHTENVKMAFVTGTNGDFLKYFLDNILEFPCFLKFKIVFYY